MKFMLMMHAPAVAPRDAGILSWDPADIQAHVAFMKTLNADLRASGELVAAEGLDFPPKPHVVTAGPGGAPLVTDGPFVETKEFLVGFWIVECPSEARAHQIAARASSAPGPGGTPLKMPIEVRQVMPGPPVD
jgi:hypothetical protein